jgi:MinD-like ATPase involved in chromosome partitioning or flagellar assembly
MGPLKVLLLGEARRLAPGVVERGFRVTLDPGDKPDAAVSDVAACQFAPEGVPLIVLGTGTVADWAARRKRPDACIVDTPEKALRELSELFASAEEVPAQRTAKRSGRAFVLTYSNKGGVGKTTAAVSLALTLAEGGVPTALCDFDLAAPDIAAYFDLRPKRGLEKLVEGVGAKSLLLKVLEKLYVLPGPVGTGISGFTGTELAGAVEELLDEFPVVVGDTPPAPWEKEFLHGIFASADLVYAVVDQSKFSVRETETYAPTLLLMGVRPEAIRIVVNRYSPKLAALHEIERAFCSGFKKGARSLPKVAAVIPEGWEEQVRAGYRGSVLHREEWLKLAREVAGLAGCALEPERKEHKQGGLLGWLKR